MKRRDKFHPVDDRGEYLTGPALYEVMRRIAGDTILLSFSRGKDSLATWLELRDYFNVVPYYCYMVPGGLSFERESLDYYERFFGTKIYRFLHPVFWKNMNGAVFQPPERVRRILEFRIADYEYSLLAAGLAAARGLDNPYIAFGYRVDDSPRRRLLVLREGPLGMDNYRYAWPIWDKDVAWVAGKIIAAGVKLPRDYAMWGWTLTATDYQYMKPLRDSCPDDWETLKFWYPLIEAEFFRYEGVGKWVS